jgi:serine/threonine-protein kinase RsbW
MPPRSEPDLRLTLLAAMTAPGLARNRLGRWLDAHAWPAEQHDDLVLAVSEAVSNSVEHGYGVDHAAAGRPGPVELSGVVHASPDGMRHAVLTVTDRGVWRPPSGESGYRRRGIPLMEACAATVTVDGTSSGTTVVLCSRAVPPA